MRSVRKSWTEQMRRRHAVWTALDYTREQTINELRQRLELNATTLWKELYALEAAGLAHGTSSFPVKFSRARDAVASNGSLTT
jgi:hypothetical protein